LGSGNHYLEIQVVKPENVMDAELARTFGITLPNQVVVMFHCGSRGFGHQIATDYLQLFLKVMEKKYGIKVLDRELACAPFLSPEGQDYFAAMKCAINMAYASRQVILSHPRGVLRRLHRDRRPGLHHLRWRTTPPLAASHHGECGSAARGYRAFGPGMQDLPEIYKKTGQPVIIGGSMESGSYLLVGVESGHQTFYSTAHGSGRTMSRHAAKKRFRGKQLQEDMEARGIYVRTTSYAGLAEEAGLAYKNIDDVIKPPTLVGISKPVVRFVPVGNVKG
jgi:tRNA-splicing ligase RtcB